MKTLNADIIRSTKDKVGSTENDILLSPKKAFFGSNSEKVSRIVETEANRQSSIKGVVGDLSSNRRGLNFDREYTYGSGSASKKELASKEKDVNLQKFVSKLVDSCIPNSRKDSNQKTSADLNKREGSTSVTKPSEKGPTHFGHTSKASNFHYTPPPQVDLTPTGHFPPDPYSNWRSKGLTPHLIPNPATKSYTDHRQNILNPKYNSSKPEPVKIATILSPNLPDHKTSNQDPVDHFSINASKLSDRQSLINGKIFSELAFVFLVRIKS